MPQHPLKQFLAQLAATDLVQQLAPLVVFLLVPALVLAASSHRSSFRMVLDVLSAVLPWNWTNGPPSERERRKLKKKSVRTRAEQLSLSKDGAGSSKDIYYEDEGYYPGIVNISGTYCFMDSTLQAMSSLNYLQPHIDEIHARAEALDVPTPIVDALRDILHELNTPRASPRALRPLALIDALAAHSKGKHNALFSSREHQDAQELFQLVSEAVKSEALAVYKEGLRDRGLGGLAQLTDEKERRSKSNSVIRTRDALDEEKDKDSQRERDALVKGVFDGLTANRRSCMQCGYTEAVMHFGFDNWQLALPRQAVCRLEECLADYTRLEVLTDCVCRKCSMLATAVRLEADAERLIPSDTPTSPTSPNSFSSLNSKNADSQTVSSSKRRRAREARKLASKVRQALQEGRVEEDVKGVKMERIISGASTKQAMVARPPPVLALHLNRSMHFGHYATKNTCRVQFPEILDLTPFTTSGRLSTSPSSPISPPPPSLSLSMSLRSTTPTPASYSHPRTLYRLAAVVCHYGQHSFGHYVCFRRKPRPPSAGAKRWAPPAQRCPLGCSCAACERFGPIREEKAEEEEAGWGTGRGWLRVSDESVSECGVESVLAEGQGAFMLYYERVVPVFAREPEREPERVEGKARGGGRDGRIYEKNEEARCSEETLKPRKERGNTKEGVNGALENGNASGSHVELVNGDGESNGPAVHISVGSSSAHSGNVSAHAGTGSTARRTVGARIVRNVSARTRPSGSESREPAVTNGNAHGHGHGHEEKTAGSTHTRVVMPAPLPTTNGDAYVHGPGANGDASQTQASHGRSSASRAEPASSGSAAGASIVTPPPSPPRSKAKARSKSTPKPSRSRSPTRHPLENQSSSSLRAKTTPSIP